MTLEQISAAAARAGLKLLIVDESRIEDGTVRRTIRVQLPVGGWAIVGHLNQRPDGWLFRPEGDLPYRVVAPVVAFMQSQGGAGGIRVEDPS